MGLLPFSDSWKIQFSEVDLSNREKAYRKIAIFGKLELSEF